MFKASGEAHKFGQGKFLFWAGLFWAVFLGSLFYPSLVEAQEKVKAQGRPGVNLSEEILEATEEAEEASVSAEEKEKLEKLKKEDVTKPEPIEEKKDIFILFDQRPVDNLNISNFLAYGVQFAVKAGVPANTVVLILLLPILGTMIVFFRHVIGLPGLGLLVPIALSITWVATGITAGMLLLATIILASIVGRFILSPLRIMHLPKLVLSILIVSIMVFASLTISAAAGILAVRQLSIFPVLLLILLSEEIMKLQLRRSLRSTLFITLITFGLGLLGVGILSSQWLRNLFLLYPEFILFLIPLNLIIGRYFGLRVSEYFRFSFLLEQER